MASDDDFFVIQRFQSLNAQTILWMQDRITRLEKRLDELHGYVASSADSSLTNGSFRLDEDNMSEREKIMRELSSVLHHYSEHAR